ncbi:hypothetical protein, partial [Pseudodesulfovibrio sp. JC047]|uniref:hypothetical protein n=1 Tax=Pseudodesulfovibrio sp. JC047 TaxID=2683199 RepID=UPI00193F13F0
MQRAKIRMLATFLKKDARSGGAFWREKKRGMRLWRGARVGAAHPNRFHALPAGAVFLLGQIVK